MSEVAMALREVDATDLSNLHLLSAFLAMEPPDYLISLARQCGGGLISEAVQRFIWDQCFCKAGEKSYAPYLKSFMKKVIDEVESIGGDVLDEFYEQYAYYMTSVKDVSPVKGNSWILKCISFLSNNVPSCSGGVRLVVPLQCSLNMLEGDTGCSLWPSSLFLSEYILAYPEIFTNKSCFEVGSGVGLVGICLEHVKASKVIMSDGDLSSLANLKLNLALNQIDSTDTVKWIHLPWETAKESELQEFMPDIVLGADIIYDPSSLPHLIRVLSILLNRRKLFAHKPIDNIQELHRSGRCINGDFHEGCHTSSILPNLYPKESQSIDSNGDNACKHEDCARLASASIGSLYHESEFAPLCFIACVVRNVDTYNYFIALASQANLAVRDLTETIRPAKLLPYLQSYPPSDLRLLLISHLQ
ncbi:hypothetical protein Nepgr_001535 [Nepenthes gracilis]|uniref:FAM86 N-terminal domain-containing protein n=1 Tax=Nepenthes gracilis TaxID=150966 RepID=A0AAD3P4N0_NEPGR|nr:hypothetical protein Nepgr_001535 [Nepenthes gracilis]